MFQKDVLKSTELFILFGRFVIFFRIGAIIGKASKKEFCLLTSYGNNLGIAFQIKDDILEFSSGESERKKDLRYFGQKANRLLKIANYIINRIN
jgi:hypothetical protein